MSQKGNSATVAMQGAASKAREEAAKEAADDADVEDTIQATPAELPDHAYIRTQATGESPLHAAHVHGIQIGSCANVGILYTHTMHTSALRPQVRPVACSTRALAYTAYAA